MRLGNRSRAQLTELALDWKQGEHVLISGGTGSGKTVLARYLDEIRLRAGGSVIVFIAKLQPDETIAKYYPKSQGWVRWETWPKKINPAHNKVIFWPKVEGLPASQAIPKMKREFNNALNQISKTGKWTVHIDEGKFMTSPEGIGAGAMIGHMFELMRSAKGTMIILTQRPSHIPLTVYSNISQAFVSRAPNAGDLKRLADLEPSMPAKELQALIQKNGRHDFTWLNISQGKPPETINLAK